MISLFQLMCIKQQMRHSQNSCVQVKTQLYQSFFQSYFSHSHVSSFLNMIKSDSLLSILIFFLSWYFIRTYLLWTAAFFLNMSSLSFLCSWQRVCKICNQCRLKKLKICAVLHENTVYKITHVNFFQYDDAHSCEQCKTDNIICEFEKKKKIHNKIHV